MIKRGKRVLSLMLVILIASLLLSGCQMVRMSPEAQKNLVVATVAGEDIKKTEFDQTFDIFKVQYEQQYGADVWQKDVDGRKFLDVAKEKVLDMLIDNKIQLKKAKDLGITATTEEVTAEMDKARKYFDSDEKFNEFLTSQKMTVEKFKDSVTKDIIIKKVKEKLTTSIQVTDEELNTYYGSHLNEFIRVKASHILVDKEDEAKALLVRVKAGEDFNTLAKENSKDPSAKENGGELGYFKQGDMVAEFEQVAFKLKPGEISDPVKTQYGYHIIRVEDSKLDKFEDVKEELKTNMVGQKKDTEYTKILEEMRSKANIKKNIKNL